MLESLSPNRAVPWRWHDFMLVLRVRASPKVPVVIEDFASVIQLSKTSHRVITLPMLVYIWCFLGILIGVLHLCLHKIRGLGVCTQLSSGCLIDYTAIALVQHMYGHSELSLNNFLVVASRLSRAPGVLQPESKKHGRSNSGLRGPRTIALIGFRCRLNTQ